MSSRMQRKMNAITALFQQGKLDEARKRSSKLVEDHPKDNRVLFAHAMICQKAGDLQAALKGYQDTVAVSPRHLLALSNAGALLQSAGRSEEAVETLRQAVELKADSFRPCQSGPRSQFHWTNQRSVRDGFESSAAQREGTFPAVADWGIGKEEGRYRRFDFGVSQASQDAAQRLGDRHNPCEEPTVGWKV